MRGFWDTSAVVLPPDAAQQREDVWPAFQRLDDIPQEIILDDLLFRLFTVQPGYQGTAKSGAVQIKAGAETLLDLARPGNNAAFAAQMRFVRDAADLRADRLDEIEEQRGDILSFFALMLHLQDDRTPWTLELLAAVIRLAGYMVMPIKLYFDVPRPIRYSQQVLPVIQTPFHGSWPSGHATEAFATATILAGLMAPPADGVAFAVSPDMLHRQLPFRMAERIATNRTVAGLHWPIDSLAGAVLGVSLGQAVVNHALGRTTTPAHALRAGMGLEDDFSLEELVPYLSGATSIALSPKDDPILPGLWARARAELA
ncbi:phosphatase PAP2 family protein [Paracoccus liaowanqingii]|uniref:Phosphatase PAP2 family protein n=1 Tax=Paracoccus liaowanqingii TaxID=2560053 RepID=A0A4Z1CRJ8_9RHOB|nr:phosphatase PAP2 family protein [Paracoccus liaowanqingii]